MSARVLPSEEVRAIAKEVGFDLCGFARPEPIPPEFLGTWLEAGMCADMDWMRERAADRLDVKRLLPDAGTVVSVACNYYWWDPEVEESPISRYARGRDYHATFKDRHRNFRRLLLERFPGLRTYSSVDAHPVMERVWAVRAGLGAVGKNGCLITEQFGSWVFLGTMIFDAEVDAYSTQVDVDPCGSCQRCMTACPTGAIVEERRIDARLCLSYQTIENEGHIPESIRPTMQNLVFGCDVCQTVCPLNAAPVLGGARFAPRAVAKLGVRELAALTPEQFAELTPGTPLARAKYDGLRRNAAYALGAMRDGGARDVLLRLALDPSEKVRVAATWALDAIATPR